MNEKEGKNFTNNKLKQKYINFKWRIKKRIQWNKRYLNLKYFKTLNKARIILSTCIIVFLYIMAVGLFIWYIGGEKFLETGVLNINYIGETFNISDLVISQISMTLLVVTVVSLMSNLDNKYIYGEKAIEVIFHKKGILSIKVIFNVLIFLMFINLAILIKGGNELAIIGCFLLTVLIIVYITFKFTIIYTNPEKIKSKWQIVYLEENEKHIRKARPIEANMSIKLEKFKNITLQYIQAGDFRYSENIDVYFQLLEVSLFNNKELIQEYYTEHISYSDFIAHIATFTEKLFQIKKYDESMKCYKKLYDILNYYEVVLVEDSITNGMIKEYIDAISYIKTKIEIKGFQHKIFYLMENYWRQLYLYSVIDLSYCRLAKEGDNLIYYFAANDILESYYCTIMENKNLNNEEKREVIVELFDSVRMLGMDRKMDRYTITNFKQKESFNKNVAKYPNYLYAEPITLMILKTIEKKDFNSFKLFLSMKLEKKLMNFIKLLCLISLLEAVVRGKKEYYLDIEITIEEVKEIIKKSKIRDIKVNIDELDLLYSDFISLYNKDLKEECNRKHVYSFHPRLRFNVNTIGIVFCYIAQQNGIEQKHKKFHSRKDETLTNVIDVLYNN
ncbi:hypothetical protein K5V21_13295 [Clostridium sardiniense]|uniref:DUF2254 domain-containing protein n=1 Tax=Clostridium sardiniense TaxID=29369 RepID=A0ABS7L070_CLOSR|nr:hypothetical protein [Clostridium sardiniense]MBY0756424.1 hypothetical protein [Clostridium sardiniense]MDQ0459273.1 hypothetical protein [Clostridium sardiniense]